MNLKNFKVLNSYLLLFLYDLRHKPKRNLSFKKQLDPSTNRVNIKVLRAWIGVETGQIVFFPYYNCHLALRGVAQLG